MLRNMLLGAMALVVAMAAPAAGQEAAYGTAAAEIAEQIARAFPRVEGRVIGLERERVLLDLGQKDQVIPGLELQVYREGQEFKHPYTGQLLGKLDRDVGRVRILEVQPNFSLAETIQQAEGTMVQQGDRVRLSSARVILALPNVDVADVAGVNTRAVTRDLTNALLKTNRFEVMTDQRIRGALAEESVAAPDQFADPATLQALWKRLRVSAVLLGKLSQMEKGVQWDVQVVSTVRGDSVTLASAEVKGIAPRLAMPDRPRPAEGGGATPRVDQVVLRSDELPYRALAMAAGELTGDGTVTLAITDGQHVYIYSLTRTGLKELARIPGGTQDNIIALDAADINKNGIPELFITNFTDRGLRSSVLEYQGGKFVPIWSGVGLHFRVLAGADGTARLFAQEGGLDHPFRGNVREYAWQGKGYAPGRTILLPKLYNMVYGFALADLDGDGREEVLILDHQDYLRIYDAAGAEIHRSGEHYGGSEIVVERYPVGSGPGTISGVEPNRVMLQGRILFQDLAGDGKPVLLMPRNTPSTGYFFKTRLYDKGRIIGATWDGIGVLPVWETRELPGYLADFALADLVGSGRQQLVALVSRLSLFGTGKNQSQVIVLDLAGLGR